VLQRVFDHPSVEDALGAVGERRIRGDVGRQHVQETLALVHVADQAGPASRSQTSIDHPVQLVDHLVPEGRIVPDRGKGTATGPRRDPGVDFVQ
jgi:hypothetical protein